MLEYTNTPNGLHFDITCPQWVDVCSTDEAGNWTVAKVNVGYGSECFGNAALIANIDKMFNAVKVAHALLETGLVASTDRDMSHALEILHGNLAGILVDVLDARDESEAINRSFNR